MSIATAPLQAVDSMVALPALRPEARAIGGGRAATLVLGLPADARFRTNTAAAFRTAAQHAQWERSWIETCERHGAAAGRRLQQLLQQQEAQRKAAADAEAARARELLQQQRQAERAGVRRLLCCMKASAVAAPAPAAPAAGAGGAAAASAAAAASDDGRIDTLASLADVTRNGAPIGLRDLYARVCADGAADAVARGSVEAHAAYIVLVKVLLQVRRAGRHCGAVALRCRRASCCGWPGTRSAPANQPDLAHPLSARPLPHCLRRGLRSRSQRRLARAAPTAARLPVCAALGAAHLRHFAGVRGGQPHARAVPRAVGRGGGRGAAHGQRRASRVR